MARKEDKIYLNKDVEQCAIERIDLLLNHFDKICISISGGKDSTVLFDLVYKRCRLKNIEPMVMFLDQEAEYENTIEIIEYIMSHPHIQPIWFQVPIRMTNATSINEVFLHAWNEADKGKWMRQKHKLAIHSIEESYPDRFYDFLEWFNEQFDNCCNFIGLRTKEDKKRWDACTSNPGFQNLLWTTNHRKSKNNYIKAYPLYDWDVSDIWHYISKYNIKYNKIYDLMYKDNKKPHLMRVSNLIHEHAFQCLTDIKKYEPLTFDKLCNRIGGIHVAEQYAKDSLYNAKYLPETIHNHYQYLGILIKTIPFEYKDKMIKEIMHYCKYLCNRILKNDWEGNLSLSPFKAKTTSQFYDDLIKKEDDS